MLTTIDHVVVYVSGQKAALDFYVNKLGFELRACGAGGILYSRYWLSVAPAGCRTSLVLALRHIDVGCGGPGGNPIMLTCDDLRATYNHLSKNEVEFTMHPIGGLEWVSFADPDGNLFHITDNPPDWIDEHALERLMNGIPDGPLVDGKPG